LVAAAAVASRRWPCARRPPRRCREPAGV